MVYSSDPMGFETKENAFGKSLGETQELCTSIGIWTASLWQLRLLNHPNTPACGTTSSVILIHMTADLLSVASTGAGRLDTWRDGEGVVLSRAAVMPWPSLEPTMGWPFSAGAMRRWISTSEAWPSCEPAMGQRLFVVCVNAKMNED